MAVSAKKTTRTSKTNAAKRADGTREGRKTAKRSVGKNTKAKKKPIKKAKRGRRMDPARGWRLSPPGAKIVFAGTLLSTVNAGKQRLAIFSVPKRGER